MNLLKKNGNNEFLEVINKISDEINCGRELISNGLIESFQADAKSAESDIDSIMEEGRTLKLGIVGEVKAGKSSFLNALLFNGKDILPKAPTPMTAALTKISYSASPQNRVFFYNKNDWEIIKANVDQYNERLDKEYENYCHKKTEKTMRVSNLNRSAAAQPDKKVEIKSKDDFEKCNRSIFSFEQRACKEVYNMVMQNGINVTEYLSDEPVVIDASGSNCMENLQEYVGSKGKFTPIVKYTEIQLNDESLKGIEVIDTPGLNDPILSRSRTTQNFLKNCDAVFLLSYAGQFLGDEDIRFLTKNLPNDGIRYAVIIGSKFDSGILDFPDRKATFKQAYITTRDTLTKAARDNLRKLEKTSSRSLALINTLKKSDVSFVSSLMYSAAIHKKNNMPYSAEEAHIIGRLKDRFGDFHDDIETLEGFANIDDVKNNAFTTVKAQKEAIIEDKKQHYVESQISKFIEQIYKISVQFEANYAEFKKTNIDALEEKRRNIEARLNQGRSNINTVFSMAEHNVDFAKNQMILEAVKEAAKNKNIETTPDSEKIIHWKEKGLFNKKKVKDYVETKTHNIAKISDLQDNIESYKTRLLEIINSRFAEMLNINKIKDDVKRAVLGLFDIGQKDFDENIVLSPVKTALGKISIPELDINVDKYYDMIYEELGDVILNDTIRDDHIPIMLRAQNEIFNEMLKDATNDIECQCCKVCLMLSEQADSFTESVISDINDNIQKIQKQLEDKQNAINKYEEFQLVLKDSKKLLRKLV